MANTRRVAIAMVVMVAVAALICSPAYGFGCFEDCFGRCSNGKNEEVCKDMCDTACTPVGEFEKLGKIGEDLFKRGVEAIPNPLKPHDGDNN
ncbi:hypothetical protein QJS04_geneDACA010195 [Acorus gramineus]|uniref:Uncharacterized protein n=1 Tax=Acorus gramineus TaxID=55184 RepID=A0AAV9A4S9_ACOGR|nr:hypothetical protein QJS04_geneDACA010195 [Acorus gramineus]